MPKFDYKKLDQMIRESAVQRKEENQVFVTTYLQNLMGGEVITEVNFDATAEENVNGYFAFTTESYRFARFNEVNFGCEAATNESQLTKVENKHFYYCHFNFCGFSNVLFENCAFVGCNFSECYTLGFTTIFRECRFMNSIKGEASIDDAPSLFTDCELSAKFVNCDLSMSIFEKSHFYFSRFESVNFKDAIFLDVSFDTVHICESDLRNTKFLKPKFIEFYFEDALQKTQVSKNTYLDQINMNIKEAREVRFAADVYSQFSELFENSKLMDLSGEYFYLYKTTESLNLTGLAKFKSFIGKITCGYGERPFFSLLTSLGLVFTCGTLYMFFGVNINNEVIAFRPTLQAPLPPLDQLIIWYHFSLVTFSTVGYGNVVPVGGSLIVSAFEMVLGIIMVGIWVSTLVRKMVR